MRSSDGSFFGRRKGKALRPAQREGLERLLPRLLIDIAEAPPDDLTRLFSVPVGPAFLEIGFGGGEHLLHEARRLPGTGFIGVEPFENGLAKAVSVIRRDGIRNVRLFDRDAVLLLDWLPPASLDRVDLLFPDPWPKRRHWKRRFVNRDNLDRLARCLKPGGVFRFASDVDDYVRWTVREAAQHDAFALGSESPEQFSSAWPDWPGTRYEAKAIAEGRQPAYLRFRRTG
jgi:tRNA (guanine-N7-)-methyltransferase